MCAEADVPLVEDGSQATGGGIGGRRVGALGEVGVFSLVSGKNLQTFGGGIVSTDSGAVATVIDAALEGAIDPCANQVRTKLKSGFGRWFLTTPIGHNGLMHPLTSALQRVAPDKFEAMFHEERVDYDPEQPLVRLSDAQGAIGCLELAELDRRNLVRRNHALRLLDGLKGTTGIGLPAFDPVADNTFNAVAVRVADAAAMQSQLRRRGVDTRSDYMSWYGAARDFEEDVLYLPNHPGMTGADVDRVVRAVREVAAE
jgi:dTDP-4-amino-4,6-dideoxygalactose transaminase